MKNKYDDYCFKQLVIFYFRFNVTADLNLITTIYKKHLNDATHADDICYMLQ